MAVLHHIILFLYTVAVPPFDVRVFQNGTTNIVLSWIPSFFATGYKIDYYSSEGYTGSVEISGRSARKYSLPYHLNEDTYTISIVALSDHFYSDSVTVHIDVGPLGKIKCMMFV